MENRSAFAGNDMISINILTLDSQRYTLRVHKQILIGQLKEEIARSSGVPREHQLLLYSAQRLSDDRTLSYYNVENGHTLHLVTRQPNATSSDLNHEDHAPFNNLFHDHGNAFYTNQENPDVMRSLIMELTDLSRRSSALGGGGFSVASFPNEQPLVDVLQSAGSLLNNIALSVYILRFVITNQRSDPDRFEQRIRNYAWILRDQLWRSLPYLGELGHVMNDVIRQPAPTMPPQPPPPPPMSVPSQPERTRPWRNNGASSSNSNNNAAGTSAQNLNATENVNNRNRRASDRPRETRPNSRRRRNAM